MSSLSVRHLRPAHVLTAISNRRYCLIRGASSHHPNVWVARSESDGSQAIVKSPLRVHDDEQQRAIRQLDTEMTILNGPLKHAEGIRQLVDQIVLTQGPGKPVEAGVFEYLDVDLDNLHRVQKRQLSPFQIKSIARQILTALSNMHKHNIVHTDLKPENIVFSLLTDSASSEIIVKLIDLGVASQGDEDRDRQITNPYWRSPESWVGMSWGPPTDVWSFGAIIASLIMEPGAKLFQPMGGRPYVPNEQQDREFLSSLWTIIPFSESFLERIPNKWREEISKFSPRLAPTGVPITLSFIGDIFEVRKEDWVFVRDILQTDPDKRPTADELLQHSWLSSNGF